MHRLGVDMGQGHLQVADVLNVGGYFEDRRWQLISKQIGGQGYTVRWKDATPDQLNAYRRLIAKCSQLPLWGVKGPRMAFTFHHIWPLFEGTGTELRVVWASRDFGSVVESFKHHTEVAYGGRWPMTTDQARALMEKWRKALTWQLGTFPGTVYQVDYDQLLEEPVTELLALHDYCYDGLDIPGHQRVVTPALNWLEKGLRHYDHRGTDAGQGSGDADAERGTVAGWTRKRPCRGCRGRRAARVDAERQPAPADNVDGKAEERPDKSDASGVDLDGDG